MDFLALYDQYGAMRQPWFSLSVGGKKLAQGKELRVTSLKAELSAEDKISVLTVTVMLYQPEEGVGASWLSAFQIGAKAELSLGYRVNDSESLTVVFCGCVYELHWSGNDATNVELEAVCMDARALMMLNTAVSSEKSAASLIKEILGKSPYHTFATAKNTAEVPKEWEIPLLRAGQTDFELVCYLAHQVSAAFYVYADTLYFEKERGETEPLVTFSGWNGIRELERIRSLEKQAGKVTVRGMDEKGARVSFGQAREKDSGTGVKSMASALSGGLVLECGEARTMAQAQKLAKAQIAQIQRHANRITGALVGLPEVRPGRFIQLEKTGAAWDGSYYVTEVTHIIDETGFETHFEAEG